LVASVALADTDLALKDDERPYAGLTHARQGVTRLVDADLAKAA
jgi:hypothetical protein